MNYSPEGRPLDHPFISSHGTPYYNGKPREESVIACQTPWCNYIYPQTLVCCGAAEKGHPK